MIGRERSRPTQRSGPSTVTVAAVVSVLRSARTETGGRSTAFQTIADGREGNEPSTPKQVRPIVIDHDLGDTSLLRTLFAKRRARFKGVMALPGVVALLFLRHAFEDGGVASAVPYVSIVLLSGLYLFRPMLILWAPVFAAFVFYAGAVLVNPDHGPRSEWIIFLLFGIVPALFLWLARPRELVAGFDNGVSAPSDEA